LLKLAGLYLPAGLLAGCLPGRFWSKANAGQVALAALGLSVGIEAAQVLVISRVSSATDALVGATAAMVGWRLVRGPHWGDRSGLILGLAWFVLLAVISWEPFGFPGPAQPFDWIPGMALEGGNPLSALEEILTKLVLFGLAGVAVAASPLRIGSTSATAIAIGLAASALFEVGQTWTPNHSPSITDVLLGGLGAFVGAWATGRVLHVDEGTLR
jgi:VanZ family protein